MCSRAWGQRTRRKGDPLPILLVRPQPPHQQPAHQAAAVDCRSAYVVNRLALLRGDLPRLEDALLHQRPAHQVPGRPRRQHHRFRPDEPGGVYRALPRFAAAHLELLAGDPLACRSDRLHDLFISRAAAQVPCQGLPDLLDGRCRVLRQQRPGGEHETRRAEATLHRPALGKGLHHVPPDRVLCHPFDGQNLCTVRLPASHLVSGILCRT